jgi:hypothetical protein
MKEVGLPQNIKYYLAKFHKVNKHNKMCFNFVEYIVGEKIPFFGGKITTYFVKKEKIDAK